MPGLSLNVRALRIALSSLEGGENEASRIESSAVANSWSALARVGAVNSPVAGALPQPWDRHRRVPSAFGHVPDPWEEIALNPQPLPPRWALLAAMAEAAVVRAELFADIAAAGGGERVVAARYIAAITEELCPPPVTIKLPDGWWRWWPVPPQPRPNEITVTARDLLAIAVAFDRAARDTAHPVVREALNVSVEKLAHFSFPESNLNE